VISKPHLKPPGPSEDEMNSTSYNQHTVAPDSTAVRVALWRALHVEVDQPPHVLEDQIGLKPVAPEDGSRPPSGHGPALHTPLPRLHRGSD
jgi:hypothetical protein